MILRGKTQVHQTQGVGTEEITKLEVNPPDAPSFHFSDFVTQKCPAGDATIQKVLALARQVEALPLPSQDAQSEPVIAELSALVNGKNLCR